MIVEKLKSVNPLSNQGAESQIGSPDIEYSNFWNQPLPSFLRTVSGNKANFNLSYGQTHSSMFRRKVALKVEVSLSDGTTQLIDLGSYLISMIDIEGDSATITLDDLSKPLVEKSAALVKDGYDWYQNVSIKFLVEELVKQVYFDKRNGQIPRDFIIQGLNKTGSSVEPQLSAIGKPPLAGRLSPSLSSSYLGHSLVKAQLGSSPETVYIGVGPGLYTLDTELNTTMLITSIPKNYNIKKLWYHDNSKTIFGMAWPTEELVNTEVQNEETPVTDSIKYMMSMPIGVDFIVFKVQSTGLNPPALTIIYDSGEVSVANSKKLITGEYHIVPPRFRGLKIMTDAQMYYCSAGSSNFYITGSTTTDDNIYDYLQRLKDLGNTAEEIWRAKAIISSFGNFKDRDLYRPTFKGSVGTSEVTISHPQVENITIPYAQKVGVCLNKINSPKSSTSGTDIFLGHEYADVITPDGLKVTEFEFHLCVSRYEPTPTLKYRVNSLASGDGRYLRITGTNWSGEGLSPSYRDIPARLYKTFTGNCPAGSYNFKGEVPGSMYATYLPYYTTDGVESTQGVQFDPCYLSYYYEALTFKFYRNPTGQHRETQWVKDGANIWPWLKFSSGQLGSIAFTNSTSAPALYFPIMKKSSDYDYYSSSDPLHFSKRCITPFEVKKVSESDNAESITPNRLDYDFVKLDLTSGVFSTFNSWNPYSTIEPVSSRLCFPDGNSGDVIQPFQITAIDSKRIGSYNLLAVAGYGFRNSTDTSASLTDTEMSHQCMLRIYHTANNGDDLGVWSHLFGYLQGYGQVLDSLAKQLVVTDIKFMRDIDDTRDLLVVAGYRRGLLFDNEPVLGQRPIISNSCYVLYVWSNITTGSSLFSEYVLISTSKYQYKNLTVSNDNKTLYFISPENRDEGTNGFKLKKVTFKHISDNITGTFTELGDSKNSAFGESNNLSNIVPINIHNIEALYGVSDVYYRHPINKIISKNYLWKYDKYQAGMVELADFKDMKVWEALSKLAQASNSLMGFDNDIFFFVPKTSVSDPDIIIDLDIDQTLKIRKRLDYNVKNIVKATPFRTSLGEISWSITTVAYDEADLSNPLINQDRTQLRVNLLVQAYDTRPRNIVMKTVVPGIIPYSLETTSDLRFAFMIYNASMETRLLKPYALGETSLFLTSLYGKTLDEFITRGDVVVLSGTDSDNKPFTYYRRILIVSGEENSIIIDSPIPQEFPEFSIVTIIRSYSDSENNVPQIWSDQGCAFCVNADLKQVISENLGRLEVSSITNLGIGNVIQISDISAEFVITDKNEGDPSLGVDWTEPWIKIQSITTGKTITSIFGSSGDALDLTSRTISAFWVPPTYGSTELIEVGSTGLKIGFAEGSRGKFWINTKGEDRIEIKYPGLTTEQDSNASLTVVDKDSVQLYGQQETTIDSNPFLQMVNLKLIANTLLEWKSKPKIGFSIEDVIQGSNRGGVSKQIPVFKVLNTSEKRLFKVRIVSKKYLPYFKDYSLDCYLTGHRIDLKNLNQDIDLISQDPY